MELSMTMRTVTADLRWGDSLFTDRDNFDCDTSLGVRVTHAAAPSHASWNMMQSAPSALAVSIAGYYDEITAQR